MYMYTQSIYIKDSIGKIQTFVNFLKNVSYDEVAIHTSLEDDY